MRGPLAADLPNVIDVFTAKTEKYPAYRIPALLAAKSGALLAFAEGRANLGDHAENDIVLKRSVDGGESWLPLQVVADDGANALNNPCAVLLRETGRILLLYQRYLKGFDEHNAEPGLDGPRICRTFQVESDDEGRTWSVPREITRQVKRPIEVTSMSSGPGIGIQLDHGRHAGRILIPFNQGPYGRWKVYAVMSDDRGESWRYGETAPEGGPGFANEVQFVELPDGTIMLNARNQGGDHHRKVALSRDGGETWSETKGDPTLIEPVCQASLLSLAYPDGLEALVFCNPASSSARTNGLIRFSFDNGKTWPTGRVIYPGSFGYSCLAALADGSVVCLFERDGYSRISFLRFPPDWSRAARPKPALEKPAEK